MGGIGRSASISGRARGNGRSVFGLRAFVTRTAVVAASLTLAVVAIPLFTSAPAGAAGVWTPPTSPATTAPFNECPAINADSGCGFLIILPANGPATIVQDTSQGPYDGNDDTLVGILNETGVPIPTVALSSTNDIFNFDGDGLCTFGFTGNQGCPFGSTGYEGPGTSFSGYSGPGFTTGNVNFSGTGLATGSSTFFSLESSLSAANFTIPASFVVTKTANPASPAAVIAGSGTPIAYTLAAKNVGGVAGNITVTDTVPAGTTLVPGSDACPVVAPATCLVSLSGTGAAGSTLTWTLGNVAAGGTVTVGFSVTANASDATGTITNIGDWNGPGCTPSNLGCPTNPVSTGVTAQNAVIGLTKTANPTSVSAPGTVTYTYTVSNPGNVTLNSVGVTDPMANLSPIGCGTSGTNGSITLAPNGGSAVCTATLTVTQANIDAGTTLTNTGTASGIPAGTTTPITKTATANVTITRTPKLSVLKTAAPATVSLAGQTVTYTFAVTNTGNVTESGVSVADTQAAPAGALNGAPTCTSLANPSTGTCSGATVPTLLPGQTATFSATYTVSQKDMDNGSINDSGVANGTSPSGAPTASPASPATVGVTQTGGIGLTKSANPTSVSAPGNVTYTYTVSNPGNVTLSGVGVTDPMAGLSAIGCGTSGTNGSISLAPGASATCTATLAVTQANIDAGTTLTNTGTASGTPAGSTSPITKTATANVTITQTPKLSVVKTANPTTVSAAGQTVTYTFVVTNNGNVTESGVGVADALSSPSVPANLGPIGCGTSGANGSITLAPGASVTCSATYTVSQADMDGGTITDTATATGKNPQGGPTTSPPSTTVTVTATQSPSISVLKTASPTKVSMVGATVTYNFAVTNTGNVTLHNITINDVQAAPSLNSNLSPVSCPTAPLAPKASENCTATYTVTQSDLNHGSINDTATASGTTQLNKTVTSAPSSATVQAVQTILTGRAFALGIDATLAGAALVGPATIQDTGGVTTAASTTTPLPCAAAAAVADVVFTGNVCAGVTTIANPASSTATASVANLAIGIPTLPVIDLQAVQSTSTTTCAASSGSITIAALSVGGVPVISKPTLIAPNTTISVGLVTLVLNQQIAFSNHGDTGLTVNAVAINVNVLGAVTANVVVASSTSDIECSVPTTAPVLTGEANDVTLLASALGPTVLGAVTVNDTSPVVTNQATTTTPACYVGAIVTYLAFTGNVCASVTTVPNSIKGPASSTATASVANVVASLPGLPVISLQGVQSTSTTTCASSTGSITIAFLKVGSTTVISKPTLIAPNTPVVVGALTLILNQQIHFAGPDTGLTVNAVAIALNTGGLVNVYSTVASSTSDILDC
jgi:uncharacterized repeat protein (TIGR01451 family)